MLGTCWTARGEGDTVADLVSAVDRQSSTPDVTTVALVDPHARTNLRLTDRPLQAYDLQRIEVALREA